MLYHSFCSKDVLQYKVGLKFTISRLALQSYMFFLRKLCIVCRFSDHRFGSIAILLCFFLNKFVWSHAKRSATIYEVDKTLYVGIARFNSEGVTLCLHWLVVFSTIHEKNSSLNTIFKFSALSKA